MASAQLPRRTWCLALLLCLSYLESALVLAQSGDGGAAGGVQPGSLGADSGDQTSAAASGPDTGSANLSHGAVIAIAVVVSLTVVLGSKYQPSPILVFSHSSGSQICRIF